MLSFVLIFLAGCFEGFMDVLQFHWSNFKTKHRNCNSWFWCPELSWRNKYKDGNPIYGEKFLGSTTIFVSLTDAWHLFKILRNLALFSSLFFVDNVTIIGCLFLYGINRIGFNLIYNGIYK